MECRDEEKESRKHKNRSKSTKRRVSTKSFPDNQRVEIEEDISKKFPNFAALTKEERFAFFEALTEARNNVEKKGEFARDRFGTVHDEYLDYFHKKEASSSSLSSDSSKGTSLAPSEVCLEVRNSSCSLPSSLTDKETESVNGSNDSNSEKLESWSEYEPFLESNRDKIIDLYLKKRKREERWLDEDLEGHQLTELDDYDLLKSQKSYLDMAEQTKRTNKENVEPDEEIPFEKTESLVCSGLTPTPRFDALNEEEREIFFKILKEAHHNVLVKDPGRKTSIVSVDSILRRYLDGGDGMAKPKKHKRDGKVVKKHVLPTTSEKNLKVIVTVRSGDNERLGKGQEQPKHDHHKRDHHKQEQLKQEQLRQEQLRQEQLRQEQLRQEQLRQEQLRQEQLKQEQLLQEQLRQEQLRQEQLDQEQLRQEQLKQEQLKKEQRKQEQLRKARAEAIRKARLMVSEESSNFGKATISPPPPSPKESKEDTPCELGFYRSERGSKCEPMTLADLMGRAEQQEEAIDPQKEPKDTQNEATNTEEELLEPEIEVTEPPPAVSEPSRETLKERALERARKYERKSTAELKSTAKEDENFDKNYSEPQKRSSLMDIKSKYSSKENTNVESKHLPAILKEESGKREEKEDKKEDKKDDTEEDKKEDKKEDQKEDKNEDKKEDKTDEKTDEKKEEKKNETEAEKKEEKKEDEFEDEEGEEEDEEEEEEREEEEGEEKRKKRRRQKREERQDEEEEDSVSSIPEEGKDPDIQTTEKKDEASGTDDNPDFKITETERKDEAKDIVAAKATLTETDQEQPKKAVKEEKSSKPERISPKSSIKNLKGEDAKAEVTEVKSETTQTVIMEEVNKVEPSPNLMEEKQTSSIFDVVRNCKTGRVVLVGDDVIEKITQLIQDLEIKTKAEGPSLENEYLNLLLDYIEYLSVVLNSLTKQKRSVREIETHVVPAEVHLKFEDEVVTENDQKEKKDKEEFFPKSISEMDVSAEPGPSKIKPAKEQKEPLKEERKSSLLITYDSESGSSADSDDSDKFEAPITEKQKKLPNTKIRILQDLLKERAEFVEGSIDDFKIVQLPAEDYVPTTNKNIMTELKDETEDYTEKSNKLKFLRALAKFCRCWKTENREEDTILENLKGEAVVVDVTEGKTRDAVSATLNASTMEVLKAAERKRVIQKRWKAF